MPKLDHARAPVPETRDPSHLHWWPDAVALGLLALVVRLPALFSATNLGYDDGGYGLAAIAMREGFEPFRDIFSSQGPLFLPLVHVADLLGFQRIDSPRLLAVGAGMVTTVAVYACGIEVTDRGRALLAGVLAATSGVLLWTTGPLTGDGPAAAFATTTVAVALAYRRNPTRRKAVAIGILAGAAIGVKSLLAGPAVLVAWLLVLATRRRADALIVPGVVLLVLLVVSVPWGTNVYYDNVQYHLDKTGDQGRGGNLSKLITTFASWDVIMVAIGATGVGTAVLRWWRRRGDGAPPAGPRADADAHRPDQSRLDRWLAGTRVLWWWAALVVFVLLIQDPLFRNHLTALVAPLALLVAAFRPPWPAVVAVGLVAVPFQVSHLRPVLTPSGYQGKDAIVERRLAALPGDAWVLSDTPGLVWRAGLATDPFFVDPSELRIIAGQGPQIAITEDRLVDAAARPRVCAVVVTSDARFGRFTDLPARLTDLGYTRVEDFGGTRGVYTRPCTR